MTRSREMMLVAPAFVLLSQLAVAQTLPSAPVPGEITRLALDLATGDLELLESSSDTTVSACYSNSSSSGSYAIPPVGQEYVDWGAKHCGLQGIVSEFTFGYGTTALDPRAGGPGAALEIALYAGPAGLCLLGNQMARYTFGGLPGSPDGVLPVSYTVTVDVSSAAFPLKDGPSAWSYVGIDGLTGPLLVKTTGVCGGPPDPLTGTVDCIDIWLPSPPTSGACAGTVSFTTPGIASFWIEIGEEDGSVPGSQAVRLGSGINPGVLAVGPFLPAIGAIWQPSITTPAVTAPLLDFLGIATAPHPGLFLPGLGEILIGVTPPNPVLVLSGPAGIGTPFSIPVPLNTALAGLPLYTQAGQVSASAALGLTNAVDAVLSMTLLPCDNINPGNTVPKFRSKYADIAVGKDCPPPSPVDLATAIAGAIAQGVGVGDALCDQLGKCPADLKCKMIEPMSAGVVTDTTSAPDPVDRSQKDCFIVVTLTLNGKCKCQ